MPTEPIVTIDQIKQMGFRGIDGQADGYMDSCIIAATDLIQALNAPRVYIPGAVETAVAYNGSWATGVDADAWLTLDNYPLISISAITEDGIALTFGSDFSAYDTKDVWVDMARGKLRRSSWSSGYSNIVVTARAGYADESLVPWDLKMAAGALAIMFFRMADTLGMESVTRQSGQVNLVYDLPQVYQDAIYRHGPVGRQVCR